jgi:hypothetical protein
MKMASKSVYDSSSVPVPKLNQKDEYERKQQSRRERARWADPHRSSPEEGGAMHDKSPPG